MRSATDILTWLNYKMVFVYFKKLLTVQQF